MSAQDWITPEAAWLRLEEVLAPLPSELVTRRRSLGRVLATDVEARVDVPAQDVSAMDGYAVGAEPTLETLPVRGTVAAGDRPGFHLEPDTAVQIMTGAPVPEEADRVVPIELTDGGTETVTLRRAVPSGAHIRRRSEVVGRGDLLLPRGSALTPGALATLATHGVSTLEVHRAPTVAVVTTGDEVVPPGIEPGPGQLRDSHTDFLLASGRGLGIEFASLGIAADDPEMLAERVSSGMRSDVLIIGGGVSKGAFDWVEATLVRCGCELLFHNVAIQPGKPMLAARHAGGLVFGLPGNPNAVMATYTLFVRPALRRLLGYEDGFWHSAQEGILDGPLPQTSDRDKFLSARLRHVDGKVRLAPITARGSHDMNAFSQAAALIRVRAGSSAAAAGDPCSWQRLEP